MVRLFPNPSLGDILYVAQRAPADERHQWKAMTGLEYEHDHVAAVTYLGAGPKFVLVTDDDLPVSVGGFTPLRDGVWRDWMINTEDAFLKYRLGITRECRRVMNHLVGEPGFRRVECVALASRQRALDWYRILGLESEGIQRCAGTGGEDFALYYRMGKS